jgi:hypothetical protein
MRPQAALCLSLLLPATLVAAEDVDVHELFRDEAGPGRKTVWQWTDEQGQFHITEHPGEIPQAMWPRVRKRTIAIGDADGSGGSRTAAPRTPAAAPREAAPDLGEWVARRDGLVADYRQVLQELDEAGYALQRATTTGAPPARVAELRAQRESLVSRAQDLWQRMAEIPKMFAAAGGNEAWIPPLPTDLPPPPKAP